MVCLSIYRIKQCTSVSREQMILVHHEMGHVEYFSQYNYLPAIFKRGANPGILSFISETSELWGK